MGGNPMTPTRSLLSILVAQHGAANSWPPWPAWAQIQVAEQILRVSGPGAWTTDSFATATPVGELTLTIQRAAAAAAFKAGSVYSIRIDEIHER